MALDWQDELRRAVDAIRDGYEYKIEIYDEGKSPYVIVRNPEFSEDNGQNPFLVFAVIDAALAAAAEREAALVRERDENFADAQAYAPTPPPRIPPDPIRDEHLAAVDRVRLRSAPAPAPVPVDAADQDDMTIAYMLGFERGNEDHSDGA